MFKKMFSAIRSNVRAMREWMESILNPRKHQEYHEETCMVDYAVFYTANAYGYAVQKINRMVRIVLIRTIVLMFVITVYAYALSTI